MTDIETDLRTDELLLNMGPQHPSTHGVLRLVLRTDGEVVSDIRPMIGYLHRSAEKIGENLAPRQFLPYTDRLDYLAAMNMNLGWALTVEKLLGLEVSEKCRHLRTIVCELDRISSHLVAAGCYGLDLGSFTPFTWTFRERERILNLFEAICGARLTYSYITVGGVTADAPPGWLNRVEEFLNQFAPVIDELHAVLTSNAISSNGRQAWACFRRKRRLTTVAVARCSAAVAFVGTCAATASRFTRGCTKGINSRSSRP